ncbi:TonB-dependent receptor [Sphingomonas sp. PAMC 26605]|uniref:TonB-dependent receptor n=1 Tax=Sphingomonas sp. PAMC 26605 TaxID=1112214 RepID=UPI00026CA791|nr:TonB-dependent receptor [Sphingomonas sp. PAMC 26605]
MIRTTKLLTLALAATPTLAAAQQATQPAAPQSAPKSVAQPDGKTSATAKRKSAPAPVTDDSEDGPDIIVRGTKPPGSVIGDIPPEQTFGPADIRSYGVGSITELLSELAPQIRSDRGSGGAPVVLLDGKRISSFSEVRDLPTEAIARVEILPEEVALKYGYSADQKVVNIVLRRRFRAATVELSDKLATEGGRNAPQGELDLLQIANKGRVNLHLEYQPVEALTESERGIVPTVRTPPPGATTPVLVATDPTDQRPFRTLLPSGRTFNANTTYARSFGDISGTLNATLSASDTIGLLGLPTTTLVVPAGNPFSADAVTVGRTLGGDFAPLEQRNSTVAAHLGTTFNGTISKAWQWSVTGTYDHAESKTFTDAGLDPSAFDARLAANDPTANPFGALGASQIGTRAATRAYSTSDEGKIDALFTGTVFKLPAGDISTSVHLGGDISSFDSRSYRNGLTATGAVSRDIINGQLNVDVPLTSRAKDVLAAIGTLSVNGNVAVNHLSDFGTLTTLGYGLNWSPVVPLRIIASATTQDTAPSATQLGNPQIVTPNVPVFDYVLGQNASVTTISGGNPNLIASSSHTYKLSATLKPWSTKDLSLTATYIDARIENPIASFPTGTAAIEAAFPSRFTRVRDANGDLVLTQLDTRPINFAQSSRSELRWGINFSMALKSKLQKQIEAWRAGTGPNPFAGIKIPESVQRQIAAARAARGGGGPDGPGGPGGRAGGGGPGGPGGGPGGGRGGFGGFGGGGGRGGGGGGGRLQFALYHTWHFTDHVLVQRGGPSLDLLNGDAIGSSGGQPRHELEGQAGYNNNGLGVRFSANWQSATDVNGGTLGSPQNLHFSALGTLGVRLFGDLGQRIELIKKHPWMRGMRIAVAVDNLFDARQRVTDANGTTPVAYQPDYLNPLGRTVRLSVRKLFF